MLKRMQRRFVLSAMAAFCTVVLLLLLGIQLWTYRTTTRQLDDLLQVLSHHQPETLSSPAKGRGRFPFPYGNFSNELQYTLRFFIVTCDADSGEVNEVRTEFIASISEQTAADYARSVLHRGKTGGFYKGYRYHVYTDADRSTLIFLNAERELQAIENLLQNTLLVAMCCLLILFILVSIFSRRVIAPFVRNLETQKRFITGASHELKTPLTSIAASADVLALEQDNNEWVQNIQAQSRRMSKLIADLITLSRLDEEQPYPNKAHFSLSETAWEISEPFSAMAGNREFLLHIEDDISYVGDRDAIGQMLSILLDNANKYTDPNGTIRLDVAKKQRRIEICVYNTCHIVNYENIDRIFERFYRLDECRTADGSYGIGLSIAKAIVENHDGTIQAETHEGSDLQIRVVL